MYDNEMVAGWSEDSFCFLVFVSLFLEALETSSFPPHGPKEGTRVGLGDKTHSAGAPGRYRAPGAQITRALPSSARSTRSPLAQGP